MKASIKNHLFILVALLSFAACKKGESFNLFTVEQDKEFGLQLKQEILNNPSQYPLLDTLQYATAYQYIHRMRDQILQSDNLRYKDDFTWELYIIEDDSTLNAFCSPGGYIFVYTGLIKYLDEADHLAGVLGHEIAHADMRHSTTQMTQQYGITLLLSILAGDNPGQLAQIAAGLTSLGFSRSDEKEADAKSVEYLCDTDFASDGAAAFFQKLEAAGGSDVPAFLSTHPSPDKRVDNIKGDAQAAGCDVSISSNTINNMTYAQFKAMLP